MWNSTLSFEYALLHLNHISLFNTIEFYCNVFLETLMYYLMLASKI